MSVCTNDVVFCQVVEIMMISDASVNRASNNCAINQTLTTSSQSILLILRQ